MPDSIYCCAIRYTYGSICLRLDMSLSGRVFLVRQSRTYRIEQSEIYRICIANISNAAGVYRPESCARRARKIPICRADARRDISPYGDSIYCPADNSIYAHIVRIRYDINFFMPRRAYRVREHISHPIGIYRKFRRNLYRGVIWQSQITPSPSRRWPAAAGRWANQSGWF